MTSEEELRLKLRKIEALFEGAGTIGERDAAEAALERIKAKLAQASETEESSEYTFTFGDQWSKQLFLALCRRYSLKPYRYARQRYTTVMVRVPKAFVDEILWPHYQALSKELKQYLKEATAKIISEEIHRDTTEAQEIVQLLEAG
jgi:tRNA nucleotidyltransferase (CCA-adding enzyme)